MGFYKLNIDASFFTDGSRVAGAMLRNSNGEAVVGGFCPLDHILDATMVRAGDRPRPPWPWPGPQGVVAVFFFSTVL
jgi:hypothetical protein